MVFLGDRSATLFDVIANTLGAVVGGYAANALRPHLPDPLIGLHVGLYASRSLY